MFIVLEAAAPSVAPDPLPTCGPPARSGFGDRFAVLEPIYRRERAGLLRYLAREAGADAAPDLLHEVFLRAAASPQVFELINPLGFLYRIARNLVIDRARRSRCRIELLPILDAHDALSHAEQEHRIEADDLQIVIDRALADLPLKTRRVFVMNRFGGMSYREIQAALGISLATVEYHMMRALSQLRRATQSAYLVHPPTSQPGPSGRSQKIISDETKVCAAGCVIPCIGQARRGGRHDQGSSSCR
ncbi:MAG: RNA polymerase sigma factor [Pseudomonadota bacterium]|nr:RNA polymerase sigma factor [Pseudomonadota bacterium]